MAFTVHLQFMTVWGH